MHRRTKTIEQTHTRQPTQTFGMKAVFHTPLVPNKPADNTHNIRPIRCHSETEPHTHPSHIFVVWRFYIRRSTFSERIAFCSLTLARRTVMRGFYYYSPPERSALWKVRPPASDEKHFRGFVFGGELDKLDGSGVLSFPEAGPHNSVEIQSTDVNQQLRALRSWLWFTFIMLLVLDVRLGIRIHFPVPSTRRSWNWESWIQTPDTQPNPTRIADITT